MASTTDGPASADVELRTDALERLIQDSRGTSVSGEFCKDRQ